MKARTLPFYFLFLISSSSVIIAKKPTIISILGTGYVGLVTGTSFANIHDPKDFHIICADIEKEKIEKLKKGIIPIYEPGLSELVVHNMHRGTLSFSSNIPSVIAQSDVIFIAVGTPTNQQGQVDLHFYEKAIEMIIDNAKNSPIVIIKSTTPIGTCKQTAQLLSRHSCTLASNPEFLREGTALNDFMNPDRIIIGTDSDTAKAMVLSLHQPLLDKGTPVVSTDVTTAETIKYCSNNFLALKLSYINEIAHLCDKTGANICAVSYGVGLDKRINHSYLQPGPGFGGSCLPKDSLGLLATAQKFQVPLLTIAAAVKANAEQQIRPFKKLMSVFDGNLKGKTIAILGLSFKANTDDVRYSSAIPIIQKLLDQGAIIKAYDPVGMQNMQKIFNSITYTSSAYEALHDSDALMILTEWQQFQDIDLAKVAHIMRSKIIIDARNCLPLDLVKQHGFIYRGIGKNI